MKRYDHLQDQSEHLENADTVGEVERIFVGDYADFLGVSICTVRSRVPTHPTYI